MDTRNPPEDHPAVDPALTEEIERTLAVAMYEDEVAEPAKPRPLPQRLSPRKPVLVPYLRRKWPKWSRRLRKLGKALVRGLVSFLAGFLVVSELVTIAYVWITPPRTSYMLQAPGPVVYQYVSLDHITRYVIAAAIAHEDMEIGPRVGAFDIGAFTDRAEAYVNKDDDTSGSTIPQQLTKNIFLWSGRTFVRKGIEAVLATEFALTLSDKRVVELYLNYAQFAPNLYGICAASWYYYGTPPWYMSEYQAAQLMGVLPLPNLVQRAPGGGIYLGPDADPTVIDYVNGSANVHVPQEIAWMGGWQEVVSTIGITDTAADHADTLGEEDACSSYPVGVVERLNVEGF